MPPRSQRPRTPLRWLPGGLPRQLPGDLPKDVVALAGVAFCVALGFGVVAPAIPLFAKQFGVSATAAGAVVSAFALMRFLSGLFGGRLVDWLGERTSLVLGLGVVAVSSLLAGLAQSYPQLLVLRGVGGVGSAVFGVAAVSLVLRVVGQRMRGRAMSVYRSGFLVGGIVGPALGGAVLGISLRAPFFLYAGTLALAGAVALAFLTRPGGAASNRPAADTGGSAVGGSAGRDAASDHAANGGPTEDSAAVDSGGVDAGAVGSGAEEEAEVEPTFGTVVRTRQYQAALVANLAVGISSFGLRSALVPLLLVDALGVAPSWVGVAFLVSALVQTALMLPAGRWTDTAGRRPALIVGAAVTATGLVLLALSGALAVALVGMAVFGAGSAFLGTAPGALVGDVAGRRSGTVVAVFNMASDLGAVVGPLVAGLLVDHGSYPAAFAVGAGVVLLAGLAGLRLPAGRPDTA